MTRFIQGFVCPLICIVHLYSPLSQLQCDVDDDDDDDDDAVDAEEVDDDNDYRA